MDRNEVLRLALEAGFSDTDETGIWVTDGYWDEAFERFAALVAAREREACAQVCDEMEKAAEGTDCCKWPTPADCAYVIRARGKK